MWALTNQTPYSAERSWTRNQQGMHLWLVAVKATFDITATGKLALSDEQPPPLLAPEYTGDPATSSLRADSDLMALKPTTDVLLDACAHAPQGEAVPTVPVILRIGAIDKTLLVHGTRVYYNGPFGLTTTKPRPFVSRPIQYEWAFGGTDTSHPDPKRHRIDTRNPVGKGFAVDASHLEKKEAHAIEYPHASPGKAGPAGFGPIASFWSPRFERAGTYDATWEKTKKPLFPDDYDDRQALASPDDQRPAKPLRGGEMVVLVNMTPQGTLRFELPKVFPTFRTRFGWRRQEHRAILATVHIAADARKLTMVWQSALPVMSREVDYLDETVISEKDYL
jgi:hypothetical protein